MYTLFLIIVTSLPQNTPIIKIAKTKHKIIDVRSKSIEKINYYTKYPIPEGSDDISCLALNLYFEARNQKNDLDVAAVGYTTLNRVSNRHWPNDICKVVWQLRYSKKYKKWVPMFSWTLDKKSDEPRDIKAYERCKKIAKLVIAKKILDVTNGATHYHTTTVNPYWSSSLDKVVVAGNHIFYR